jgi:hypothetical protein
MTVFVIVRDDGSIWQGADATGEAGVVYSAARLGDLRFESFDPVTEQWLTNFAKKRAVEEVVIRSAATSEILEHYPDHVQRNDALFPDRAGAADRKAWLVAVQASVNAKIAALAG